MKAKRKHIIYLVCIGRHCIELALFDNAFCSVCIWLNAFHSTPIYSNQSKICRHNFESIARVTRRMDTVKCVNHPNEWIEQIRLRNCIELFGRWRSGRRDEILLLNIMCIVESMA